jgi:hypothetical protein
MGQTKKKEPQDARARARDGEVAKPKKKKGRPKKAPGEKKPPKAKPPVPLCGAKAKTTGNPCKRKAGAGTSHPGQGRCSTHGGNTPVITGRYSQLTKQSVIDAIGHQQSQEAEPADLRDELTLARAILEKAVENHDDLVDALLAWNAALDRGEKPAMIPDLERLIFAIGQIAKIAKTHSDIANANTVPLKEMERVMVLMAEAAIKHLRDQPEIMDAIRDEWRLIYYNV